MKYDSDYFELNNVMNDLMLIIYEISANKFIGFSSCIGRRGRERNRERGLLERQGIAAADSSSYINDNSLAKHQKKTQVFSLF